MEMSSHTSFMRCVPACNTSIENLAITYSHRLAAVRTAVRDCACRACYWRSEGLRHSIQPFPGERNNQITLLLSCPFLVSVMNDSVLVNSCLFTMVSGCPALHSHGKLLLFTVKFGVRDHWRLPMLSEAFSVKASGGCPYWQ